MNALPPWPVCLTLSVALGLCLGCSEEPEPESSPSDTTPPGEPDGGDSDDSDDDNEGGGDADRDVLPTYFAASDVSDATLELIEGAFAVADTVWMTPDAAGTSQFNPVYIAVLGTDTDAAVEAEEAFCDHLAQEHPEFHARSRCVYPSSDCDAGVCYFADQAGTSNASISSMRSVEGFHLMILTERLAQYGDSVLEQIVLHESFHVFQLAHAFSDVYDEVEERQGRMSGDTDDLVPWWMEGTAEYMAVTTYGREMTDDADHARQQFQDKLGYSGTGSEASTVEEYFDNGVKLYNIGFDDNAWMAYSLGAWMVAWLVDQHGEQTLFDFYNNLDAVPFDDNFEAHFGVDHRTAVGDFEEFLDQSPEDVMALWD